MPEFDPKTQELINGMLLMAGLLVVVALGIQVIAIARRRMRGGAGDPKGALAESFREAYEAGELSTDEYRQIREAMERGHAPPPPPRAAARPPSTPEDGPPPPAADGAAAEEPPVQPPAPGTGPGIGPREG